jgi:hypothetical protein
MSDRGKQPPLRGAAANRQIAERGRDEAFESMMKRLMSNTVVYVASGLLDGGFRPRHNNW